MGRCKRAIRFRNLLGAQKVCTSASISFWVNNEAPPILITTRCDWTLPLTNQSFIYWGQNPFITDETNITIGTYSGTWNTNTTTFIPFCTITLNPAYSNGAPYWCPYGTTVSHVQGSTYYHPTLPPTTSTITTSTTTTSHLYPNYSSSDDENPLWGKVIFATIGGLLLVGLMCGVYFRCRKTREGERQPLQPSINNNMA